MPATFDIPTQSVIPGQLITSALWNGEFVNIFNGFTPTGIDDYSSTDGEMQTQTNPFPGSVISRPTALSGELERLRFVAAGITGKTYWYQPPTKTMEQLNTFDLGHTHTGTTDGTQVPTAGIADGAVTNPKLGADSVNGAKIADDSIDSEHYVDGSIDTAHIADAQVTNGKLAAGAVTDAKVTDVAFSKITGTVTPSDGTVTAAKIGADAVSGSKIADDSIDSEHYVDGSIDPAHLSAGVLALMGIKLIQRYSVTVTLQGGAGTFQATGNQTITSVDLTKAFVSLNGVRMATGTGWSPGVALAGIGSARLTSATNVAVTVSANGDGDNSTKDFTVDFEVIEFN